MNKKTIITVLSGFAFGVILTFIIVYQATPGIMLIENEIPYSFDEAVEKYTQSVDAQGWSLPKVYDLKKTMAKHGHDVKNVKVFELCHPEHANKILEQNDERIVSSLMPCRVAIYEKEDGKVYVSRMNSGLLGKMMDGVIPEVMGDASRDSETMLAPILN